MLQSSVSCATVTTGNLENNPVTNKQLFKGSFRLAVDLYACINICHWSGSLVCLMDGACNLGKADINQFHIHIYSKPKRVLTPQAFIRPSYWSAMQTSTPATHHKHLHQARRCWQSSIPALFCTHCIPVVCTYSRQLDLTLLQRGLQKIHPFFIGRDRRGK